MVDLTAHLDTYDALTQEIAGIEIKRGQLLMQMRVILEQEGATEYPDATTVSPVIAILGEATEATGVTMDWWRVAQLG